MKRLIIVLSWGILFNQFAAAGGMSKIDVLQNGTEYFGNKIIITATYDAPAFQTDKSVSKIAVSGVEVVDEICRDNGVIAIEQFYPGVIRKPALAAAISRIYIFSLSDNKKAPDILSNFIDNPYIKSADLFTIPKPFYIPNDPRIDEQWYLEHTNAYGAWDVIRGDTTRHAVVGIIDTGVYWDHPDLAMNMFVNSAEDINSNGIFDPADNNGVDNDSNGFIDDVMGWDFGDNDNNAYDIESIMHGTAVAGCISEVTDNDLHGAAIGFRARLMPVKVFNSQGGLVQAYQGAIYAADNGADVINFAWGLRGQFSQAEQTIINAIYEENVFIVAGAGAFSDTIRVYPAAYNHVMAVISTTSTDYKASFSSYGTWADICAPGIDILTTYGQNMMAIYSGTSMSSGIVSGLAALIRAKNPQLSVDLMEVAIESTADTVPNNNGLYGAGRINCQNAVLFVSAVEQPMPRDYLLAQNFPNPFNASTVIKYSLPHEGKTQIRVYDIQGQCLETIVDGIQNAGSHITIWDAESKSSGIYFYRLVFDGISESKPMILLK